MKHFDQLKNFPLFSGLTDKEIQLARTFIPIREVLYSPKAEVMRLGQNSPYLGFIISGKAHVERIDYWGNRSLYEALLPGSIFSEIYACGDYPLNIQITSAAKTEIMLFDMSRLKNTLLDGRNPEISRLQIQLLQRLLQLMADKGYRLSRKMEWTARCSIQDRVSFYLSQQASLAKSNVFDIPLNRQELADHLFVDRSALSSALSKMRDAGLLKFSHNHFELLQTLKPDDL